MGPISSDFRATPFPRPLAALPQRKRLPKKDSAHQRRSPFGFQMQPHRWASSGVCYCSSHPGSQRSCSWDRVRSRVPAEVRVFLPLAGQFLLPQSAALGRGPGPGRIDGSLCRWAVHPGAGWDGSILPASSATLLGIWVWGPLHRSPGVSGCSSCRPWPSQPELPQASALTAVTEYLLGARSNYGIQVQANPWLSGLSRPGFAPRLPAASSPGVPVLTSTGALPADHWLTRQWSGPALCFLLCCFDCWRG